MFVLQSDALMDSESNSLQEHVIHLEKKVQQQDDEIICLKSALADALRRLSALEIGMQWNANYLNSFANHLCCCT